MFLSVYQVKLMVSMVLIEYLRHTKIEYKLYYVRMTIKLNTRLH